MFRSVADEVGAALMADVAHYSGLIVGGQYQSPVGIADIVTTTTHKNVERGPRGWFWVVWWRCANEEKLNKWVFPGLQGGPLMHQNRRQGSRFLVKHYSRNLKSMQKNVSR